MCRYVCCGCYWGPIHKVLGFELTEEDRCDPFIRIEVTTPHANNCEFFCIKFNSIPTGLTSYPLMVHINDEDVAVETRDGRVVTSADLCPCSVLSGVFHNDKLIVCGV